MADAKASSTFQVLMAKVLENQALLAGLTGLTLTGGLFLAAKVFSFVRLLFSLFILPGKSLRSFGPRGSWAVVTGASDGIGAEFATQLAASGFNVVLASRTASKLTALASRIEAQHSVKTHTLAIDFSAPTDAQNTAFADLLAPLDIAILINNVGQSHSIPTPFTLTPPEEREAIIAINCASTLHTTSLILPGMRQRRRGLVLTMGSFAGLLPTPLLATYSGSKAFLQHWSSALAAEMAPHGVYVSLVQSYLVTSAMSKVRRPSLLIPTPRAFVRSALRSVGRSGGAQGFAYSSTPYWSHALLQWVLGTTLGFMGPTLLGLSLGMHEEIRGKALRKMAREKRAT